MLNRLFAEENRDGVEKLTLAVGLSWLIWKRIKPALELAGFVLVFGAAWVFLK